MKEDPRFHSIDLNYPGLAVVSPDPGIFLVHEFLTEEETAQLLAIAQSSRLQEYLKNNRRCFETRIPDDEVSSILDKVAKLLKVERSQLELMKVTRYQQGGFFNLHHDSFEFNISGQTEEDSNRISTLFVYLNRQAGTDFPYAQEASRSSLPRAWLWRFARPVCVMLVSKKAILRVAGIQE